MIRPWNALEDLRFAARAVRRRPLFACTIAFLIALGIGLTSATFAIVDAMLLRKLPVPQPDQLIRITGGVSEETGGTLPRSVFEHLEDSLDTAASIFAWSGTIVDVQVEDRTEMASILFVTGDYYATMGARPQLGRLLHPSETEAVAVVNDGFWRTFLGADPDVIGKTVHAGAIPLVIVGVTEPNFRDADYVLGRSLTVPVEVGMRVESVSAERAVRYPLDIVARLSPGATMAQIAAELETIWPGLAETTLPPDQSLDDWTRRVGPKPQLQPFNRGRRIVADQIGPSLFLVFALAIVMLAAVCVNVAGLLLANGFKRQKEVAVQIAIGAGRWRIVRQWFAEALLMGVLGAAGGVLLSTWLTHLGARFVPHTDRIDFGISVDARIIALAVAASIAAAMVSALIPAVRVSAIQPSELIKSGDPLSTRRLNLRKMLLAFQVAISVALLVGSSLFVGTLAGLRQVELGFRPDDVVTVMLAGKSPWRDAGPDYFREMIDSARATPGVRAASVVSRPPMETAWEALQPVKVEGSPRESTATRICAWPGLFETLGTPLHSGRDFDYSDRNVAILSAELAEELFPGGGAVGSTVREGNPNREFRLNVIGVAGNARFVTLRLPHRRTLFMPCATEWTTLQTRYSMALIARVEPGMTGAEGALQSEVESMGRQFVPETTTLPAIIDDSLKQEHMLATVSTTFGLISLVLTSVGLYALVAFLVTSRLREIGIRMALGATSAQVTWLVQKETLWTVLAGAGMGLAIAVAASRWISGFLFGIAPTNPAALVGSVLLLAVVGAAAGYIPARRAAALEPSVTLRRP
jgi:predicted permease